MKIMISTNIKDPKHLLDILFKISKKYNGLHYKEADIGFEIYIYNNIEFPPEFEKYLKDEFTKITSDISVIKLSTIAFLPLDTFPFRDHLIRKFTEFKDTSFAQLKSLFVERLQSIEKRVKEHFPKTLSSQAQKKETIGLSATTNTFDSITSEIKMPTQLQNVMSKPTIEFEMSKVHEEKISVAEQERTILKFFELINDYKSEIIKKENLMNEWMNYFKISLPSFHHIECSEDKDQGTLVKFKCLSVPKFMQHNTSEKLWVDIDLIGNAINMVIFNNQGFPSVKKILSLDENSFSIQILSIVVPPRSKDKIIKDLQAILITAGLEDVYSVSEIVSKVKPELFKKNLNENSSTTSNEKKLQNKEIEDLSDDEEDIFLEKTTRNIIDEKLPRLFSLTWKLNPKPDGGLFHRYRTYKTNDPTLFPSVVKFATALEDEGIASFISNEKDSQGVNKSLTVVAVLRGKK